MPERRGDEIQRIGQISTNLSKNSWTFPNGCRRLCGMANDTPWIPSDHYPGLTLDRLLIVAAIVREARDGAADDHRPEKFEGPWSLGTRCYERTTGALMWRSQEYPWLSIKSGGTGGPSHFVMTIGGHPVRVCKGTPDDIPAKYQELSFPELEAQQDLFSPDNTVPQGRGLRIVVENDAELRPDVIYLVEVDEATGEATNSYIIPKVSPATAIVTDFTSKAEPAEIPPVTAEPTDEEVAKDSDKDKTGSGDE